MAIIRSVDWTYLRDCIIFTIVRKRVAVMRTPYVHYGVSRYAPRAPVMERSLTMSEINWPEGYLAGTTDNFVSNEITVAGLSAAEAWPHLNDTSAWETYYANASEIRFHDGSGPQLSKGARFRFTTFGFPVEAEVTEYEPPAAGKPARMAWHGWVEGDTDKRLDVHHGCAYLPRKPRTEHQPGTWPLPAPTRC